MKALSAAVMVMIFNEIHTKVAYFGRNMIVNDKELIKKLNQRSINSKKTSYINPLGNFIKLWRLFNTILLIYNATATPFRVAFHVTPTSASLRMFELFTDFIFFADIFVSFVTPY